MVLTCGSAQARASHGEDDAIRATTRAGVTLGARLLQLARIAD